MADYAHAPAALDCEACGAEPGEPCHSWCTGGDAGTFRAADLVQVAPDTYAVKHCPRCHGTGSDAAEASVDEWCRCVLDTIKYMDLRATEAQEKLDQWIDDGGVYGDDLWPEYQRVGEIAERWALLALASALREIRCDARADTEAGQVSLKTVFGAVRITITGAGLKVLRADGTTWFIRRTWDPDDSRGLAWKVRSVIPELATGSGALYWIVTIASKPGEPFRPPEVVGLYRRGDFATSNCHHLKTVPVRYCCPGSAAKRLADRLSTHDSSIVVGAFPLSDTAVCHGGAMIAKEARRAIDTAARLASDGDLTIAP